MNNNYKRKGYFYGYNSAHTSEQQRGCVVRRRDNEAHSSVETMWCENTLNKYHL